MLYGDRMMITFQVLCTTMYQNDLSKISEMNIQSNVLYGNQSDFVSYTKVQNGAYVSEMVTTNTRGSGTNRNILLLYANSDICLFADDDVTYYDGYKDKVIEAFSRHNDADMIIFNMETDSQVRPIKRISCEKKMRFWNRNPYGAVHIAIRLRSQRKYNIWFSNLFGAGEKYCSGEDTLFIRDFRKYGNVYFCPEVLGKVNFSKSTWFDGYDEKYFFNQGAKVAALEYICPFILFIYYAIKFKTRSMSVVKKIWLMIQGYRDFYVN